MSQSRQGTLRDYLRLLRNSRALIIALTAAAAGLAAAFSLSQETRYTASASVSFQEESRSNAVAGLSTAQTQTADQLAAQGVATMRGNQVLTRVRRRLKTPLTVAQLRAMLATSVDTSSTLATVTAEAPDKVFAAALANEVAAGAVNVQKNADRARFKRTAIRVERQYDELRKERGPDASGDLALASLLDRIATARTLSTTASPARVSEAATVPSSPSSPKPVRSTVLGALLGLMLGGALAFVRDSLDRRLRDSDEIQETLDLPVVGMVRVEALGGAAYVSNGRGPMTDQDVESFRILRTNIAFLDVDRPIKSIAVTSPLPQEGKSTVAASLAAANAAAGRRTLLVECDLRRPSLPERLSISRSPGLSDYLVGEAAAAEILQVVTLSEVLASNNGHRGEVQSSAPALAGKMVVIAAGSQSIRPAELLGSQRFRDFLEQVVAAYDIVVIDTPPLLSVSDTLEIVPLVDGVLLCIRADQTTRDQARAVKEVLNHLPERTTGIVVTGLKPGREHDYGYYSYAYYGDK